MVKKFIYNKIIKYDQLEVFSFLDENAPIEKSNIHNFILIYDFKQVREVTHFAWEEGGGESIFQEVPRQSQELYLEHEQTQHSF